MRSLGKRCLGLAPYGLLLFAASASAAPAQEPSYGRAAKQTSLAPNEAILRPYSNGAGPAAIFRLGRDISAHQDIFGIVDPVGWRIQFLALDDLTDHSSALSTRIHWRSACLLNPRFRLWRVHIWPQKVVLQLQPNPLINDVDKGRIRFPKLVLPADANAIAAIQASSPAVGLNHRVTDACPGSDTKTDPPTFTAGDAATSVTGGLTVPFVVRRNPGDIGSPFERQPVRLSAALATRSTGESGNLTSAQELESATPDGTTQARYFLLVSRSEASPGFLRSRTVLVRHAAGGDGNATMQIDMGLARVKTGQRFVAIASTGEVLVIGASAKDNFHIHSCHFTNDHGWCAGDDDKPAGVDGIDGAPLQELTQAYEPAPPAPPTRDAMWRRARWFVEQRYRIDTRLPDEAKTPSNNCLDVAPCEIGNGEKWAIINDLRLATGVVERRGVPYGSRRDLPGIVSSDNPTADLPTVRATDGAILLPLYERVGAMTYVVGDIENTSLAVDKTLPDVKLLGVDCSALVAAVWKRNIFSTSSLINAANGFDEKGKELANGVSVERKAKLGDLRFGDGLVINLSSSEGPLINHVVLFRESVRAGPTDSSTGILVLEASSACGGVCVSLYDESFFDGWAIVGRGAPKDTNFKAIPLRYEKWRQL